MIDPTLVISIARGMIKLGTRADRLFAEKKAIISGLILPMPNISIGPDASVMIRQIKLQAHPTEAQKLILSQWMGCARTIWNAKCQEDKYLTAFARKYMPVNTYAPVDQCFAQYKDKELTQGLSKCPSQILRNSAVNWYQTYQRFFKGLCGKPRVKKKRDGGSIHLTRELFRFERCNDGVIRSILDKAWHKLEAFTKYKAYRAGKISYRVPTPYTSQECAVCGHIHPDNRQVQKLFLCSICGNTNNADNNAAKVIKKRAINLILDSGTELSKRGFLLDKGRGDNGKPHGAKAKCAHGKETSKKTGLTNAA